MFRDLKEYQEIAKIYADKVSKPEDLDENRNTRGQALRMQREKNKPKTREEVGLPPKRQNFDDRRKARGSSYRGKKEPKYKPEPGVVFGQRKNEVGALGGGKPSSGDLSMFKDKKPEAKPKKMHSIEKKNRARFGDKHVDKLKAKNTDFKAMKKGTMSKDDFIKKYPKSITAQKAAGLRDHTEWDAYDMVLEYLYSTEQVDSLEEANYVMMEMDHQTIGEIVNEVTEALIDENV